ncbi:MAG: type III secretion system export apparatus subunit SctT [Pseudomonadota bacterium]
MEILVGLYLQFETYLLALLISIPRIYGFFTTVPILNAGVMPRMARNAAILIMCLPIVPVNLANADGIDRTLATVAYFFAKEFAIGFVFGYMIGWIFWMITATGDLIDNQRGAAIAASIDPLQGTETSPLGILFSQAFTTYFFTIGGMLVILNVLYTSYALWPVTEALPILSSDFPVLILGIFDHAMRAMFVLAAPVVAVMFLSEFALALVSRFAPQIQVFILAMPIKSGVAMAILVFYCSLLFPYAADQSAFFDIWTLQLYEILEIGQRVRETNTP